MGKKLFIHVIFEQKKYLYIYTYIVILFIGFVCFQSVLLEKQYQTSIYPDIELHGNPEDRTYYTYMLYQDIGDVKERLADSIDERADVQGVILRNLVTTSNGFENIEYRLWGMDDGSIAKLEQYIAKGRAPKENTKEVLIGGYAAKYYQVDVGDEMPLSLNLSKEVDLHDETRYIVSGILNDNIKYFRGAVIISKETYFHFHEVFSDNFILIYTENNNAYNAAIQSISNLDMDDAGRIHTTVNYSQKNASGRVFSQDRLIFVLISIVIMGMMFMMLLRGISRKVGLLKAIGLPNRYILKVFMSGLAVITCIAVCISVIIVLAAVYVLNGNSSEFYGFEVKEYFISLKTVLYIIVVNVINISTALLTVLFIGKKISARNAMLKV